MTDTPVTGAHDAARRRALAAAHRRGRTPLWSAALLALLAALALAGCTEPPQGELRWLRDDHHRIADPGALGALATGTGCAPTRGEALTKAEQVAQFNLRSLTGPGRYRVRYELLDDATRAEGHCIELTARAVSATPHGR